jgi:hypothetical protein
MSHGSDRLRALLGLVGTLLILHFVPIRPLALVGLLVWWGLLFAPLSAGETVMFVFASVFFLVQDYMTLKAGLFEFRDKDILLMPWFEPTLWGFYYLALKRFIVGRRRDTANLTWQGAAAVVITSLMFSLFSSSSHGLLAATACSTAVLLVMFHTPTDLAFAVGALALGFVVELFGVTTGMWSYPAPDFLGMPYWFATMWISCGLLGRRFLLPASEWLATKVRPS